MCMKFPHVANARSLRAIAMKSINIENIYNKIETIKVDKSDKYLLTYPTYLDYLNNEEVFSRNSLRMVAGFAYSWMPRVITLDHSAEKQLIELIITAKKSPINEAIGQQVFNQTLQYTGGSTVASSKILHFIFPNYFPIFDSHIFKACWQVTKSYHYQMTFNNYFEYLNEVHRNLNHIGTEKIKKLFDFSIGI